MLIFLAILTAFLLTFFISLLGLFLRAPRGKGARGERIVAKLLGKTVPGKQYVLHNLIFNDRGGISRQIDHVFIAPSGIWVIETKNYAGRIYGDDQAREWTQTLADGKTVNKFYNPVRQNKTHVYALCECLHASRSIFHNVVVFLAGADISRVRSAAVCSVGTLKKIKNARTEPCLSAEQMEEYYKKLCSLKESNAVTQEEHVARIHAMQEDIRKGICPRCGGTLVLRNGKNGQFWGCSNYPRCKFSKNID